MSSLDAPSRSADGSVAYRRDIDGLRALAILLVVVYHVWLGRVSGGVDVFLMISAFFLTASFARRMDGDRGLRIGTFWLRKFRRLLPAAVVTLVGILAATFLVYPASSWPEIWQQTWASLFYVQNWELAFTDVDYYARNEVTPSPLQHFWSLSVQGQVFLLWPLVFLGAASLARRTRLRARPLMAIAFGVIFVASLAFSIVTTAHQQSFAYFDTRTRLWEFAAGSLLALALPYFSAPAVVRAIIGWLGIAGVVTCGIVLDVQGGFPGYLALWPIVSTAAVILAGSAPSRWGPASVLASRPLRVLGRDAYALYLVHWPVLITWLVVTERTSVGWLAGTAIILISLVLARLVAWGVERPMRSLSLLDAHPVRGALAVVACLAVVAGPLASWQTAERLRIDAVTAAQAAEFARDHPGAAALMPGASAVPIGIAPWPSGTALDGEWVSFDGACTDDYAPTDPDLEGSCLEKRVGGGRGTVIIVGDSHAQQCGGVVESIAVEEGWDIVALLKGGCSFALDEPPIGGIEGCPEWRSAAFSHIEELAPRIVFGMGTKTLSDDPGEAVLRGLDETVDRLALTGATVVLFRDNRRFAEDMYRCAEENLAPWEDCVRDRSTVLASRNPAAPLGDRAHIVDLSDYLCPNGQCLPVIGNVYVYLDHNHLTGSYARSLSPVLAQDLRHAGITEQ